MSVLCRFVKIVFAFLAFFGTLFALWFVSSMELEGADVSKTSSAGSTPAVDDIN